MNEEDIIEVLGAVCYPETGRTLEEEGMIGEIEANGKEIDITILFPKPTDPFLSSIRRDVKDVLEAHFGDVAVNVVTKVKPKETKKQPVECGVGKVKNIIAVAGGKGGVGKSTVAVKWLKPTAKDVKLLCQSNNTELSCCRLVILLLLEVQQFGVVQWLLV